MSHVFYAFTSTYTSPLDGTAGIKNKCDEKATDSVTIKGKGFLKGDAISLRVAVKSSDISAVVTEVTESQPVSVANPSSMFTYDAVEDMLYVYVSNGWYSIDLKTTPATSNTVKGALQPIRELFVVR